MLFLFLSNVNINVEVKKLILRKYSATKALPTTSRVQLIKKDKFAKVAVDENSKNFIMYIATLEATM